METATEGTAVRTGGRWGGGHQAEQPLTGQQGHPLDLKTRREGS